MPRYMPRDDGDDDGGWSPMWGRGVGDGPSPGAAVVVPPMWLCLWLWNHENSTISSEMDTPKDSTLDRCRKVHNGIIPKHISDNLATFCFTVRGALDGRDVSVLATQNLGWAREISVDMESNGTTTSHPIGTNQVV